MQATRTPSLAVVFLTLTATQLCSPAFAQKSDTPNAEITAEIIAEVLDAGEQWVEMFNEHDAAELAKLYATKCDVENSGEKLTSRKDMEREFAAYFLKHQQVMCELTNQSHVVLSPTLVIESGTNLERGLSDSPALSFDYTAIFEKLDGKWLTVYERAWPKHNQPESQISLEVVKSWTEYLDGEWTFVLDTTTTFAGTAQWTRSTDGSSMSAKFVSNEGTANELSGWYPESKLWVARGFGSKSDHWTLEFYEGDEKSTKASYHGRLRDGTIFSGTFVGTRIDSNTYQWKATTQDTNGKELKTTGLYKRVVKR